MRHALAILIVSAGLACAELSPEDFNQVRSAALERGFYFSGISRIGETCFYTFCNEKAGLVAFAPMSVTTCEEAKAAMTASVATFIMCAVKWKQPLDQFLRREIPLPPPGFTELE
jgi:hypothetical protein